MLTFLSKKFEHEIYQSTWLFVVVYARGRQAPNGFQSRLPVAIYQPL
jgi:hypothetical protein